MVAKDFKFPRTARELDSPAFRQEMQRLERFLNAMQRLKVQINQNGGTTTADGVIQVIGDEAIIVVNV